MIRVVELKIALFVIAVAFCLGGIIGGFFGYEHGHSDGSSEGRHDASLSASSALTVLMTNGIDVKQPNGTVQTYVLKPVEKSSNQ